MTLFGKLQCWAFGHKRGKSIYSPIEQMGRQYRYFQCPRCKRVRRYKVKEKANGN